MRRHAVCTMYNNFIYRYDNFFFEKYVLQTDLQGKQKICPQSESYYNKKRMVENISGDWNDKLENFSKRFPEEENMT